jgi:hypothetical protein
MGFSNQPLVTVSLFRRILYCDCGCAFRLPFWTTESTFTPRRLSRYVPVKKIKQRLIRWEEMHEDRLAKAMPIRDMYQQ